MTTAEIHIGGRRAWIDDGVRVEPDPVRPGRALARVNGRVDLAVVIAGPAESGRPPEASVYVNGALASIERQSAEYDETGDRKWAMASMVVSLDAITVVDPEALAPIFSTAEYGTSALKALLEALPACAECVKKGMGRRPAVGMCDGIEPTCVAHGYGSLVAFPYSRVVHAIERRIREPIFRGYGPDAQGGRT